MSCLMDWNGSVWEAHGSMSGKVDVATRGNHTKKTLPTLITILLWETWKERVEQETTSREDKGKSSKQGESRMEKPSP